MGEPTRINPAEAKSQLTLGKVEEKLGKNPEDLYTCVKCTDTGWRFSSAGVSECKCLLRKQRARKLTIIPPRYADAKLYRLRPDAKRHQKQALMIQYLQAHPAESYLIYGRNGSGKTHLAWALYRHAVYTRRPCAALKVSQLLEDYRRLEFPEKGEDGGVKFYKPRLDVEDLNRKGKRWLIYLEEMDKARPTEYACEKLFNLLDIISSYAHQLVIVTNLNPRDLQQHWSRVSMAYGGAIARRISEDMKEIDFF